MKTVLSIVITALLTFIATHYYLSREQLPAFIVAGKPTTATTCQAQLFIHDNQPADKFSNNVYLLDCQVEHGQKVLYAKQR